MRLNAAAERIERLLERLLPEKLIAWLQEQTDWAAALFILAFLVSGVLTLPNYGMNWDEGLGNLFFGERYLFYLTSGQEKYLDFNADLARLQGLPLHLYLSPLRNFAHEFPPLMDILSAASMHLLAYRLGWLDAVDAFHLPTVLLSALFLWLLYRLSAPRLGRFAALAAILFLGSFPRFWGDMHFNNKDVPQMIFFALFLLAYLDWYERPGWAKALGVGALAGCALAIKANILFAPLILVFGVWPWGFSLQSWRDTFDHLRRTIWHYGLMAASAAGVYFAAWPYLYTDPGRVRDYFKYIFARGAHPSAAGWNWTSLQQAATTMPEWMLLFLAVGIVFLLLRLRQPQDRMLRLLPFWLLLPVFRVSLPGMVDFDGIRHFMEFVPAAALVAGYGASALAGWLAAGGRRLRLIAGLAITLGLLLTSAQIWVRYHPYQHLYYNRISGGLEGARRLFGDSEATDYWALSYRQGMAWLNHNAAPDSLLYTPVASWLAEMTGPLWLRGDIRVIPPPEAEALFESLQPVYVMFITRPGFYDEIAAYCARALDPLHQIVVDGRPILQIYRLDKPKELTTCLPLS